MRPANVAHDNVYVFFLYEIFGRLRVEEAGFSCSFNLHRFFVCVCVCVWRWGYLNHTVKLSCWFLSSGEQGIKKSLFGWAPDHIPWNILK